jgi:hypothetical protein
METKNQQLREALDPILDRYSDEVGQQKVLPPAAYTSTAKPSTAMRVEYGKILDLGITSNVKFPNTFGHPIRVGFTLEVPSFGELLPRVCVGPREPSRPYAIGSNAELHHNTHRSSIGNFRKAALAWIRRVRISVLRKEVPKTPEWSRTVHLLPFRKAWWERLLDRSRSLLRDTFWSSQTALPRTKARRKILIQI